MVLIVPILSYGARWFIRPIIYLRKGIEYKKGNGTKETPYELVEKI